MLPVASLPKTFHYQIFSTRYAKTGVDGDGTWAAYCDDLEYFQAETMQKRDLPLLYHGETADGGRKADDLRTYTALSVDCDGARYGRPSALLAELKASGIAYAYQERDLGRVLKYHLVLPLSAPPRALGEDGSGLYSRVRARVRAARLHLTRLTGDDYDEAFDRPSQGIHPYCIRDNVIPFHEHCLGPFALDLDRLLDSIGFTDQKTIRRKDRPLDAAALANVSALSDLILAEAPNGKGWYIRCPLNHEGAGLTKTLMRPDGSVLCFAGKCQGKPPQFFIDALSEAKRNAVAQAKLDVYIHEAAENSRGRGCAG